MNYKRKPLYERIYDKMVGTIRSTILCIRFPFLYPRNRFSGLHYHNYTLSLLMSDEYKKSTKCSTYQDDNGQLHVNVKTISYWHKFLWYCIKIWYEYILQLVFCIPTNNELDMGMPKGWKYAFGIQMCKDIKKALINAGGYKLLLSYRIMQIKEKWAGLRWYDNGAPQSVHDIINEYEAISYYTCIDCGKPAKYYTSGWIVPLCEDCITDKEKQTAKIIE